MVTATGALTRGQAKTEIPSPSGAPLRLLEFINVFRLLVIAAMILAFVVDLGRPLLGYYSPGLFIWTASTYLLLAGLVQIGASLGWLSNERQAILNFVLDVVSITLLMHASGGVRSGIGGLLVVFVAAGGIGMPGRPAFLSAAMASLAILAEQTYSWSEGLTPAADFVSAGVLGAVVFVIAAASRNLSRNLEETEALAEQRGIDLANLNQLNEYIIQNLRESIVVVDPEDHVRLINQSAAEHLGSKGDCADQALEELSEPLHRVLQDWRREFPAQSGRTPSFTGPDGATIINVHVAPMGKQSDGPVLMFLEDASLIAEKLQQSKLAALGRLSASIAHEIRNPVGAMSHAGQLMAESPDLAEDQQKLLEIIQSNSKRVSAIVENILQLSRRGDAQPRLLSMNQWTRNFVREFSDTLELFEGQLSVLSEGDVQVRMDPGQLHQVVWNLCENAMKYASAAAGGIAVELRYGRMPGSRRPFLEISDYGPGVPEEAQGMIFEPFQTGGGGTGLGLFISRELCEVNRASLQYEPRTGGGSVFRIIFSDPSRWEDMH